MAIVLGDNRYGKAETRLVRVVRDTARHEIRDLTVSSSLRGDFTAAHLDGDQANVLPTDTQKNAVYAFAKERGVGAPEEFARELARHFVDDVAPVTSAQVVVEEHRWERATVDGRPHDHTFVRSGSETRTAVVTAYDGGEHVLSGLTGLVLLKSTGSEFHGFLVDDLTTLPPTHDRVLATSLTVALALGSRPERRLRPGVRAGAGAAGRAVRQRAQPGAAADAVGDGPGRARGPRRHRGGPDVGAEQAPQPGRPRAVRARQPGRGLRRRRPALRADRGRGRPGRGRAGAGGVAGRPGGFV